MTTMRENMKKRGITETQLDAARKRLHDYINSYRDGDNDASNKTTTLESHGEEPSNGNHDSTPSDHDATYSLRLSFGSTCDVRRPDPDLHFKSDEERFDRNHDVLQKHGRSLVGVKVPKMQGDGLDGLPAMTHGRMDEELPTCYNDDLMIDLFDAHLLDGVETILELGCGDAKQLTQMVDANPSISSAYAIDLLDRSIRNAETNIEKMGLEDRIHVSKQNFNDEIQLPDGFKADLIYSCYALHGIDPIHAVDKFRGIRSLMSGGGLLAFKAAGSEGVHTVLVDLANEILMSNSREDRLTLDRRTWHPCELALESVLKAAGFVDVITMSLNDDEGMVIQEDDPVLAMFVGKVLPKMNEDGLLTDAELDLLVEELPVIAEGFWVGHGTNIAYAVNPVND